MNKFWVITSDVYKKNVKSVSFFIMLLVPFMIGGIGYISGHFASQAGSVDKIGLFSEEPELQTLPESEAYEFVLVDSVEDAETELYQENIDAFLVLSKEDNSIQGELFSETTLGTSVELTIQQILSGIQSTIRAQELGLTSEEVLSLNTPATFSKQNVSFNDAGEMVLGEDNSAAQYLISFASTIILFVFIITYVGIIAQEIASEKGTRIMEVILSSTRAQIHFYGKLTGVLLVALTQLAVYAVAFVISYQWIKDMEFVQNFLGNLSLKSILGNFFVFTIIFTILGILIYSVLDRKSVV